MTVIEFVQNITVMQVYLFGIPVFFLLFLGVAESENGKEIYSAIASLIVSLIWPAALVALLIKKVL